MQAIEFTTYAHGGLIKIPESYRAWYEKLFKVILLAEEPENSQDLSEAFHLLAGLSDDFMAEGRQQPPLQIRAER